MKKIVFAAVATAMLGATGAALAQDATAKLGCNTCHALDAKKMGPSYKTIAQKFKGKADAEKELVAKLMAGKGHPAAKGSEADVAAAVKWTLAQ
ncbi:MAG: cytochrome C' [Burkholderiaceae bacterium]